ncbi:MAG: hypothetical protein IT163_14090 [Bryobacterales bacterium]|nr:hypothetical protein [Bryobacterales bacterium]
MKQCTRFNLTLALLLAVLCAPGRAQPVRPANQYGIGDLVEDRSHGNQIVEVAGGPDMAGYYSVLIPGAGAVPVAARNLQLMSRADAKRTCTFNEGDVVEFARYNLRERGVVMRATGGFCDVKTSSSRSYEEFPILKLVRPAQQQAAAGAAPGAFAAGQTVQVRSGDYWIPAVVEGFDAASQWYTVRFPNAAAQMTPPNGYAAGAVLRKPAAR